jgi:hypothetical protein
MIHWIDPGHASIRFAMDRYDHPWYEAPADAAIAEAIERISLTS